MVVSLKEMVSDQIDKCRQALSEGRFLLFESRVLALNSLLDSYAKSSVDDEEGRKLFEEYQEVVREIDNLSKLNTKASKVMLIKKYNRLFKILIRIAYKNELLIIDPQRDLLKKFA